MRKKIGEKCVVNEQRKETRELGRVICLKKISKSAIGDGITINREIILVLLRTWACWSESRGHKMIRGREHLSCKEMLKGWGCPASEEPLG